MLMLLLFSFLVHWFISACELPTAHSKLPTFSFPLERGRVGQCIGGACPPACISLMYWRANTSLPLSRGNPRAISLKFLTATATSHCYYLLTPQTFHRVSQRSFNALVAYRYRGYQNHHHHWRNKEPCVKADAELVALQPVMTAPVSQRQCNSV